MRGSRFALVCTGAFLFVSVRNAQAPYTEVRVPEARSFTWLVNGGAQWNRQYSALFSNNNESQTSLGNLATSAHHRAESEAFLSDLFVRALGGWSTSRSTSHSGFPTT